MKRIFVFLSLLFVLFGFNAANAQTATQISPALEKEIQKCESGEVFYCNGVGIAFLTGKDAPKSIENAQKYYKLGCEAKQYFACSNLAEIYDTDIYGIKNAALALKYYEKACDGHHALSCANAGYMYDTGSGTTENDTIARQKYSRGCDYGNEFGCDNAGILDDNIYDAKDQSLLLKMPSIKRFFYHQHACYLGLEIACKKQKTLPLMVEGPAIDRPYELKALTKACYEYDGKACYEAAKIVSSDDYLEIILSISTTNTGVYKAKDYELSRLLYMRGCDIGYGGACAYLGYIFLMGENVEANYKISAQYLLDACMLADRTACANTGIQYEGGYWYEKNIDTANAYFYISCEKGFDFSCNKLKSIMPKELDKLLPSGVNAKFLRENCKKNDPISCRKLGDFYKSGTEVVKNNIIANGYFSFGCDLGDAQSCINVANAILVDATPLQNKRARQILDNVCNSGNPIACDKLRAIK